MKITTLIQMIRLIVFMGVLAGTGLIAAPTNAGVLTVRDVLAPVSETTLKNHADQQLTLCLRMRQSTVVGLPVWRKPQSYVLAENGCQSTQVSEISLRNRQAATRAGLIVTEVSEVPRLGLQHAAAGFWGWLIVLLPAFALLRWRRQKRSQTARFGALQRDFTT